MTTSDSEDSGLTYRARNAVVPADLTFAQRAACEALAAGATRAGAAKAAGISLPSLYRWLKLTPVRQYLAELTDACQDRARRRFRTEADRAAQTLVAISQGEKPKHPLQLQALLAVLDRGMGRTAGGIVVETGQHQEEHTTRIIVGLRPDD